MTESKSLLQRFKSSQLFIKMLNQLKESDLQLLLTKLTHLKQVQRRQKLKIALADREEALKEWEEFDEEEANKARDKEDELNETLLGQGRHENISFYAFTATPKAKTLEMFGTQTEEGKFVPFHVYSMRQAIEEGFILDVLKTT